MWSFPKIKPSQNGKNTLSFTNVDKSCQSREFFNVAHKSFNAICENKILTKISKFTGVDIVGDTYVKLF